MLARRPDESIDNVCEAIVQDVVRPELAKLEQRLKAAKRTLARKTAVSLALSVLAAKCGLLLGLGPVGGGTAGISAIAAGLGGAGAKYFDDKQVIELSDMYFLWKALGHAS